MFRRFISSILIITFTLTSVVTPSSAQTLPLAGSQPAPLVVSQASVIAADSPVFNGIKIYPQEPFRFDFMMSDLSLRATEGSEAIQGKINSDEMASSPSAPRNDTEILRLVKYFMASLTVPEGDLWVNLSPYEKDRIVPDALGQTQMGVDLLAQDYVLKQLTASLMNPEGEAGKKFWEDVYSKAYTATGSTNIPLDTFNKVWIVPNNVEVFQNGDVAYITRATLKVMLEEDYLSSVIARSEATKQSQKDEIASQKALAMTEETKNIIRSVIIPVIEQEVNEGASFANLRQIFHSMILAKWYEQHFKNSVLGRNYVDHQQINGIQIENTNQKFEIYDQYVQAFKQGAYDFLREEYDPESQTIIPRKYFAGGFSGEISNMAMMNRAPDADVLPSHLQRISVALEKTDSAMLSRSDQDEALKQEFDRIFEQQITFEAKNGLGAWTPQLDNTVESMVIKSVNLIDQAPYGGKIFEAFSEVGDHMIIFVDQNDAIMAWAGRVDGPNGFGMNFPAGQFESDTFMRMSDRYRDVLAAKVAPFLQGGEYVDLTVARSEEPQRKFFSSLINPWYGTAELRQDFVNNPIIRNILHKLKPSLVYKYSNMFRFIIHGANALSYGGHTWYSLKSTENLEKQRNLYLSSLAHELAHELFLSLEESARTNLYEYFLSQRADLIRVILSHPGYKDFMDDDLVTEMISHIVDALTRGWIQVVLKAEDDTIQANPIRPTDIKILIEYGFLPEEFRSLAEADQLTSEALAAVYPQANQAMMSSFLVRVILIVRQKYFAKYFQEFVVGGVNSNEVIRKLKHIHGVSIETIHRRAWPKFKPFTGSEKYIVGGGGYNFLRDERVMFEPLEILNPMGVADHGFLGENEKFIDTLVADNIFVQANGFTHQQLAEPLLKIARSGSFSLEINGKTFYIERNFWMAPLKSIFDDGLQAMVDFRVTDDQTGQEIQFSSMLPEYIARYGFYEGSVPYRLNPRDIMTMFFPDHQIKNVEEELYVPRAGTNLPAFAIKRERIKPEDLKKLRSMFGDEAMMTNRASASVIALNSLSGALLERVKEQILEMNERLYAQGRLLFMDKERLEKRLEEDRETGFSQVYLDGDKVLGFILGKIDSKDSSKVRLSKGAVAERARGQGILSSLLLEFGRKVLQADKNISVQVLDDNSLVQNMFLQLGGKRSKAAQYKHITQKGSYFDVDARTLVENLEKKERISRKPQESGVSGNSAMMSSGSDVKNLEQRMKAIAPEVERWPGDRTADVYFNQTIPEVRQLLHQDDLEKIKAVIREHQFFNAKNVFPTIIHLDHPFLDPLTQERVTAVQLKRVMFSGFNQLQPHRGLGNASLRFDVDAQGRLYNSTVSDNAPQGAMTWTEALREFIVTNHLYHNAFFNRYLRVKTPLAVGKFTNVLNSFQGEDLGFVLSGVTDLSIARGVVSAPLRILPDGVSLSFDEEKEEARVRGWMLRVLHDSGVVHRFLHLNNTSIPVDGSQPFIHDLGTGVMLEGDGYTREQFAVLRIVDVFDVATRIVRRYGSWDQALPYLKALMQGYWGRSLDNELDNFRFQIIVSSFLEGQSSTDKMIGQMKSDMLWLMSREPKSSDDYRVHWPQSSDRDLVSQIEQGLSRIKPLNPVDPWPWNVLMTYDVSFLHVMSDLFSDSNNLNADDPHQAAVEAAHYRQLHLQVSSQGQAFDDSVNALARAYEAIIRHVHETAGQPESLAEKVQAFSEIRRKHNDWAMMADYGDRSESVSDVFPQWQISPDGRVAGIPLQVAERLVRPDVQRREYKDYGATGTQTWMTKFLNGRTLSWVVLGQILIQVVSLNKKGRIFISSTSQYPDALRLMGDMISDHIPPNGSVLDFAAGQGHLAKYVMEQRPDIDVQAFDISPENVGQAHRKGVTQQIVADAYDLHQYPDESFDAVYISESIGGMSLGKPLEEARRVLKPGGTLIVIAYPQQSVDPEFVSPITKFLYYSDAEIITALEHHGFDSIEMMPVPKAFVPGFEAHKDFPIMLNIFTAVKDQAMMNVRALGVIYSVFQNRVNKGEIDLNNLNMQTSGKAEMSDISANPAMMVSHLAALIVSSVLFAAQWLTRLQKNIDMRRLSTINDKASRREHLWPITKIGAAFYSSDIRQESVYGVNTIGVHSHAEAEVITQILERAIKKKYKGQEAKDLLEQLNEFYYILMMEENFRKSSRAQELLRQLLEKTGNPFQGGTLYVTYIPCDKCATLLKDLGLARVVFSKSRSPREDYREKTRKVINLFPETTQLVESGIDFSQHANLRKYFLWTHDRRKPNAERWDRLQEKVEGLWKDYVNERWTKEFPVNNLTYADKVRALKGYREDFLSRFDMLLEIFRDKHTRKDWYQRRDGRTQRLLEYVLEFKLNDFNGRFPANGRASIKKDRAMMGKTRFTRREIVFGLLATLIWPGRGSVKAQQVLDRLNGKSNESAERIIKVITNHVLAGLKQLPNRYLGSGTLQTAADFLYDNLKSLGYAANKGPIKHSKDPVVHYRVIDSVGPAYISVVLPGDDSPSNENLILTADISSIFDGAAYSATGVSALLALARLLQSHHAGKNIILVFANGGNAGFSGGSRESDIGQRVFIKDFQKAGFSPKNSYVLNLGPLTPMDQTKSNKIWFLRSLLQEEQVSILKNGFWSRMKEALEQKQSLAGGIDFIRQMLRADYLNNPTSAEIFRLFDFPVAATISSIHPNRADIISLDSPEDTFEMVDADFLNRMILWIYETVLNLSASNIVSPADIQENTLVPVRSTEMERDYSAETEKLFSEYGVEFVTYHPITQDGYLKLTKWLTYLVQKIPTYKKFIKTFIYDLNHETHADVQEHALYFGFGLESPFIYYPYGFDSKFGIWLAPVEVILMHEFGHFVQEWISNENFEEVEKVLHSMNPFLSYPGIHSSNLEPEIWATDFALGILYGDIRNAPNIFSYRYAEHYLDEQGHLRRSATVDERVDIRHPRVMKYRRQLVDLVLQRLQVTQDLTWKGSAGRAVYSYLPVNPHHRLIKQEAFRTVKKILKDAQRNNAMMAGLKALEEVYQQMLDRKGGIDLNNLNMQTSGQANRLEVPADPAMMNQPIFGLTPKILHVGEVNAYDFLGLKPSDHDEDPRSADGQDLPKSRELSFYRRE